MLAVFLQQGKVSIGQADPPVRPPGFVLLKLILAGICNTDLELQRGYYGFQGTPGHEFVAHVVASDNPDLLGKRVVGEINLACGNCDFCAIGLGRHCRNRSVLGILRQAGAFAEYFILPEANLHVVPDSVADSEAVFTEPLAAACEILDQTDLTSSAAEVAVLGDGKLGLLVAKASAAHRVDVTVFGRHEAKLEIARASGARARIAHTLPQAAYSHVIECTGSAEGLSSAIQMTRPRGTVVMKSTVHQKITVDMAPAIVNEISLVGSRCGRFAPALELLEKQEVRVGPLISAEYPLAQAAAAFETAATRGVLKVLLRNIG